MIQFFLWGGGEGEHSHVSISWIFLILSREEASFSCLRKNWDGWGMESVLLLLQIFTCSVFHAHPRLILMPLYWPYVWNALVQFLWRTNLCVLWKVKALVGQSWLTLCNPMDSSLPGSSVHGILQGRILEWVAILFSRGSSWLRDWIWVSRIAGRLFTVWAIGEALCVLWGYIISLRIQNFRQLSYSHLHPSPPPPAGSTQLSNSHLLALSLLGTLVYLSLLS